MLKIVIVDASLTLVASLILNSILFFLLKRRTPKEMRDYATILQCHCFADVLMELVTFISTTLCIPANGRV